MRIFVTGGTGFIGSHTVVELQQQGHEVWIADNLSNSEIGVLEGIRQITGVQPGFEQLDLCDISGLDHFFTKHGPFGGVVHFAAHKAVGESVDHPLKYYRNNILSTVNLLECMKRHECTNLVFSSSCTVYGQAEHLPVTEDTPVKPAYSPYGNTKQINEEIIADQAFLGGLRAQVLRYFNPIGAHESALIGELPIGPPNNLMPYITQTAIGKRDVLCIFGNDYGTPDGTCVRDYIHVVDIAKAHMVALNRMMEGRQTSAVEIFNLGTGKGHSVMEVIHSFEKASGSKLNYKVIGRRTGDVEQVWADTRKANEILGWKAERSLDDMTLSAWKWELAMHANTKRS